jgi:hypothetical protein
MLYRSETSKMKAIAVFVKKSGVLVGCRVYPTDDGCLWQCGVCGTMPLLRASFGVMSGYWRCPCGAEVELLIDGQPVELQEINVLPNGMAAEGNFAAPEETPEKPKRKRRRKLNDEDFLRECGIARDATPEEESC